MRKSSRRERGFTLIEVMISTGLLTLVLGSLVGLLADYSQLLQEAQEKNVLMTLRRRVIQNLSRREAWIITYRADVNTSFQCFLSHNASVGSCPAGPNAFTLYGGRSFPPPLSAIVFSTNAPPAYTAQDPGYGLTNTGAYCNTFSVNATTYAAKRCPIRLDLTWELLSFGIPSPDLANPLYYPTGYFPFGYYPGTGINSYFGPGFYPGSGANTWWWLGTLGAQIRVRGTFTVNVTLKDKIKAANYDFSIIKEVP